MSQEGIPTGLSTQPSDHQPDGSSLRPLPSPMLPFNTQDASLPFCPQHSNPPPFEHTEVSVGTTWQGHHFPPTSTDSSIRISFTNTHGFCTKGTTLNDATNNLLAVHQMYSMDIGGISEHHLPMKAQKLSQRLYNAMRSSIGGSRTTFQFDSSPELPSTSVRLMGGTGLLALGNVVG